MIVGARKWKRKKIEIYVISIFSVCAAMYSFLVCDNIWTIMRTSIYNTLIISISLSLSFLHNTSGRKGKFICENFFFLFLLHTYTPYFLTFLCLKLLFHIICNFLVLGYLVSFSLKKVIDNRNFSRHSRWLLNYSLCIVLILSRRISLIALSMLLCRC